MRRLAALFVLIFLVVAFRPVQVPAQAARPNVGAYYFPGWNSTSQHWKTLKRFPERLPPEGPYSEEQPATMVRQIGLAADHGIDLFIFDWYWEKTGVSLEHAVDAFKAASNHSRMRYALMWANHNDLPKSLDEMREIARYWARTHLTQPNYWRIDGKPVVVIFTPDRLRKNLAGHAREALAIANQEARAAGLPGIYFVGCLWPHESFQTIHEEGYEAATGYNYPGAWKWAPDGRPDYDSETTGYLAAWTVMLARAHGIPYFPPVLAGWDSRPWGGRPEDALAGPTPQQFETQLRNAAKLCWRRSAATGNVVMIEAWNEFAEGSYLAPTRGRGTSLLDIVLRVFGPAKGSK